MADIFYSRDAIQLLRGKKVYLIGDSNIRALYKDIICLVNHDRLLHDKQLKAKAEPSFLGDVKIRGSALTKGRDYREDRRYKRNNLHIEFHFVTKCYNEDMVAMMNDFKTGRINPPDIIVMNSTQWDVTRWGPRGVELFKDNMSKLMHLFKNSLPPSTLVIWVCAPPIAVEIKGGYMIKQLEFARYTMRFHLMEANMFARELCSQFGFNCLDFHFHLQWQVHWRSPDGIHWSVKGMRFLGNLLLTHIALALGVQLPGNYPMTSMLAKHKALAQRRAAATAAGEDNEPVKLPQVPAALLPLPALPSPPKVRNPRPRITGPPRPSRQQQGQKHHAEEPEPFHRRRWARRVEPVWSTQKHQHSMGPPMGAPNGPLMGHHMEPFQPNFMGPPMGPPRQHMQQHVYEAPPLPRYPAPELPPLPPGPPPGDGMYANDDFGYMQGNGSFYLAESQQPIPSMWGPVRRNQANRRQRPY